MKWGSDPTAQYTGRSKNGRALHAPPILDMYFPFADLSAGEANCSLSSAVPMQTFPPT